MLPYCSSGSQATKSEVVVRNLSFFGDLEDLADFAGDNENGPGVKLGLTGGVIIRFGVGVRGTGRGSLLGLSEKRGIGPSSLSVKDMSRKAEVTDTLRSRLMWVERPSLSKGDETR